MKIDVSKLSFSHSTLIEEDVVFDPEKFKCHIPLLEVLNTKVSIKATRYEDFIDMFISISSKVKLQCSYSLVAFDSVIKGNEEYHFATYAEEGDEIIVYSGNLIDMDEILFNLLSASVPLCPIAPGAKFPKSSGEYEVLTEEEYNKQKEERGNSKFDALKDLDFD